MKEALIQRLQMIMEHREMTTSGLADALGVQRSSVSHILNGRNKPSLDFVMKVVNTFSEVSLDWFLKGEGDFPKTSAPSPQNQKDIAPIVRNPKLKKTKDSPESRQLVKTILFYDDGSMEVFEPKN
ncbi:MAG: helix-turn-helix transcriptional regulator [Bacteroidota bacterium]